MMRGLILAGGRSLRFGSDKALAVYEGRSFLSRAAGLLEKLRLPFIVVTRPDALHLTVDANIFYDLLPEKGPLGGLYTAMKRFPGDDFLALTCDMPALEEKLLIRLLEEYNKGKRAVFYRTEGGIQPFPGIYPKNLFSNIYERIFKETLSVHGLIGSVGEKTILPFYGASRVLANVNRPSDLRDLES